MIEGAPCSLLVASLLEGIDSTVRALQNLKLFVFAPVQRDIRIAHSFHPRHLYYSTCYTPTQAQGLLLVLLDELTGFLGLPLLLLPRTTGSNSDLTSFRSPSTHVQNSETGTSIGSKNSSSCLDTVLSGPHSAIISRFTLARCPIYAGVILAG